MREKKPRGVFVGDEQIFKWKDLFNSGKFCKNKYEINLFYIIYDLNNIRARFFTNTYMCNI